MAYRKVEYLQSSGTQYIDITDQYYQNSEFKLICQSENIDYTSVIFGYGAGGGFWFGTSGGAYAISSTLTFGNTQITDKITAFIQYSNNAIFINISGTQKTVKQLGQPRRLTIFSAQASSAWYPAKVKIFGLSLEGVMNLVPCVRKSDSKPGMYDTVSKTFYTNAGSGEFIVPT